MPFRRTLVPAIWISLLAATAPAQTTRSTDSGTQQGNAVAPVAEASKPTLDAGAPAPNAPQGEAHVDTTRNAGAPGAASPTANTPAEETARVPTRKTLQAPSMTGAPSQTANAPAEKTAKKVPADETANARAGTKVGTALRKDEKGVRRDPTGRKGVSPFWEAIRRGDEAALVRDFVHAEQAYQAAIAIESENPLAYLRLGQTAVRGSKLEQAEVAYQDALRVSSRDGTLRAAAMFALADLRERQGQREQAIVAWKAYADYLNREPNAKGYPETPLERESRIRKYIALAGDSKAVRERIDLRIKEVDDATRRKATNNPNANR